MSRVILAAAALAGAACAQPAAIAPVPTTTTTAPTVPPTPAPTVPVTVATTAPTTTSAPPVSSPPAVAEGPPEGNGGAAGQTARASWYGAESGSRTADGTAFDGSQMVFAHRTMAFGTLVRFCHAGACVVARCADRGPAEWTGKTFDLSRAVFAALAPLKRGVVTVTWETV